MPEIFELQARELHPVQHVQTRGDLVQQEQSRTPQQGARRARSNAEVRDAAVAAGVAAGATRVRTAAAAARRCQVVRDMAHCS